MKATNQEEKQQQITELKVGKSSEDQDITDKKQITDPRYGSRDLKSEIGCDAGW